MTEPATVVGAAAPAATDDEPTPKRGFPHPMTILGIVILAVWIITLFIPAGEFREQTNIAEDGSEYTSLVYERVDAPLSGSERVEDLLLSPVNGMYGVQDPDSGHIGPFNSGRLFGGIDVVVFILAIGGFMTVVFRTGALNLGIARLAHRFADKGPVLIIVLSVLFGILGSVMSWSDETLGMYPLLIPLFLALGYDRMVAFSVIWLAPAAGIIGSTVNPFKIGIGSAGAGVEIGDGIVPRLILFVALMAGTIVFTLRYAARVRADPANSVIGFSAEDQAIAAAGASDEQPALSGRDKGVIGLVAFTFVLLVFSIVPWGSILGNTGVSMVPTAETGVYIHETYVKPFSWELGWWLPELSIMFAIMAFVVGSVARLGEAATVRSFMTGVSDFMGPALLVAVARAVSVILNNTKTIDTVLNALEGLIGDSSNIVFVFLLSLISLPISFLVGAGSAGNALVMPLLAPLGHGEYGIGAETVVTIFNAVGAWFGNVLPTNALLLAGLGLAKIGFDKYFKFVLPLMGLWLVIQFAVFIPAAL